ncbi:hypothetical protein BS78_K004300 [Paspalum vaginatum]|uniref:DUF223 domain-containing protein n=1 Tax=Paspalum vaginatum TaxID=158149 RepID=A0A9W7XDE1_9POAL|nr:hypothetical protein BS78_K004300 [Paspalum vaginatum]
MAPVRIGQKKITTERQFCPRFKRFDDVDETFDLLLRTWSIVVRVEVKFPVEPRYRDKQHFILVDTDGSKVEAIAYNNDVRRFDNLLHQGFNYTIHRVIFGINWGEVAFRNIAHRIELTLTSNTTVEPYTMPLCFPRCPRHLMPFHEVFQQPNRRLVDVMGIILCVEPVELIGRRRYRGPVIRCKVESYCCWNLR